MKRVAGVLKWLVVLGLVAVAGWLGWTRWVGERGASQAQTASTAQIFTVRRGSIAATLSPTGLVYARAQKPMSFNASNALLTELNVRVGQEVKAGDVLARIDETALQNALDKAEADYLSAQEALEALQEPHSAVELQRLEAAVSQAEYDLQAARQALAELLQPDVTAAKRKARDAQAMLSSAQDALAEMQADPAPQEDVDVLQWQYNELEVKHGQLLSSNPSPTEQQQDALRLVANQMADAKEALERAKLQRQLDLLKAEHEVSLAQDNLSSAVENLADLQEGTDPDEAAAAELAVAQAEYNVRKAQEELADAQAGPDAAALKLAQARHDSAKAVYEEAKLALEGAVMKAPFDGTITRVGADLGDTVSPSLAVVAVADLTDLRIQASIDETQIAQVEFGQPVEITFDAHSGRTFQGQVLEVPLQGTLANNVVTYAVTVSLESAEGLDLRVGMTANLNVLLGESQDALLVPAMAIKQSSEGAVV
ncbi:MAG: HlyD family efflux transporter periplasmic adaptor subunit, partial [Chloroflexi bacterium]|nr:HlyD family efflux transporter periplasmic adaptor subunit [Chloroflexota bacterium]